MFKKSKINSELDLYSSVNQYLNDTAIALYNDKTAWHNMFYQQVYKRIDETIFTPLFADGKGAPNASIKTLVSMMTLKEAFGWSDQELFQESTFNLLVRKALNLINLYDSVPVLSTYYLFRKRLVEHTKNTNEDLIEKAFKSITQGQILEFNVHGKSFRMDSKLIGSNIAFYSRYEIIHQTLCLFHKYSDKQYLNYLPEKDNQLLQKIIAEDSQKTVYRNSKEEISKRLTNLGIIIYKILNLPCHQKDQHYQTLQRVFAEQYNILDNEKIELQQDNETLAQNTPLSETNKNDSQNIDNQSIKIEDNKITQIGTTIESESQNEISTLDIQTIITDKISDKQDNTPETCILIDPKNKKEISAQSVQSPYDTDCTFREKNGEQVKGYSYNVAETCDTKSLNLIADLQVEIASCPDNEFIQPAVNQSQPILNEKINNLHTDGAYNSQDNQAFCNENNIDLHLTGLQGHQGRFDLGKLKEELIVTDRQSQEKIPATLIPSGKYRINTENGYRYFDQSDIDSDLLRKKVNELPPEIRNKRNNVEASIFQLSLHLRNNKTKYRGLIKNKIWATVRCLWINLARIIRYTEKISQRTYSNVNYNILINYIFAICFNIFSLTRLESNENSKL